MKTIVGILISFGILAGASAYELVYVDKTFEQLHEGFLQMYLKTEAETATAEDGNAVRIFWEEKKRRLHFWLPHTIIGQLDTELGEAIGYLYEENYMDALPKWEVLVTLSKTIPHTYALLPENIF